MRQRVIVRLPNWLGDTVMAVPALRALRAALPDAEVLAIGPWAMIVAGQDLATDVLEYPRSWRARWQAHPAARSFGADAALLLPNSLESAVAAILWGTRQRIGFATDGRAWLLTDVVRLPSAGLHQIDEYLVLAEALGARPATRVPSLVPPGAGSDARQAVRRWLAESGLSRRIHAPLVGVHLGAAYGSAKQWPASRIIELCTVLAARGADVVLLGPPGDRDAARDITARVPVASLVGRDRPADLSAVLAELDAVVAGDTGVAHLAAALGTPVTVVFGPTDPRRSAPRGPVTIARHPVPCSPCTWRTCPIDHPCMLGVTGVSVATDVLRLVGVETGT
jgi:heptosyltransferase-2